MDSYLSDQKKIIDKALLNFLRTSGAYKRFPTLDKSLRHTLLLKGKRLRPIITLMSYELFSDDKKRAIGPACAVELIHVGSLMLDDLPSMDNAEYRRGKKANHVLYGDATTILASAALWVEAFRIITEDSDHSKELVSTTAELIGKDGLVLGQYMDLYAFNKKQSIKELRRCYELKTGTLFKLAMSYGAILAEAPASQRKELESFGNSFGLAYQIRDDILDVIETAKSTGKDVNKDSQNQKPNYVSILGLDGAKKSLSNELENARDILRKSKLDTKKFEHLLDVLSL